MNTSTLVLKLWSDGRMLRDDSMGHCDCVEQLTSLRRLKMADERAQPPFNLDGRQPNSISKACARPSLLARDGDDFFDHDCHVLPVLGLQKSTLGVDVKGDAYEGLLKKNAQDTQSRAGQYFTPRAFSQAMVDCMVPKAGEHGCDPARGTAGFRFAACNQVPFRPIAGDPVAQP